MKTFQTCAGQGKNRKIFCIILALLAKYLVGLIKNNLYMRFLYNIKNFIKEVCSKKGMLYVMRRNYLRTQYVCICLDYGSVQDYILPNTIH